MSRSAVLASPFWDRITVEELGVLLVRRLEVGVAVVILGRFSEEDEALQALAGRFSGRGRARIFPWHAVHPEDPLGSQTFHFKAAVADGGDRAYVGSANLTLAGLRSRMELGVLLRHEPAFQVARILDAVLSFSSHTLGGNERVSDGRLSTEYIQDKAVTRVQRVVHEAVLAYEEVAESSEKANEHDAKTCYEGLV